jgi:hypothetical protein
MKNIYIIIISCFFISCNQNNNDNLEENNKEISSQIVIDSNVNYSEYTEQEIFHNTSSYGPDDILRVSPENLKVDGGQRYFLNDSLFTGLSCHYEDDIMLFEIQFKEGRKNGKARFFYKNGQQKNMQTFKNGISEGPYIKWDKLGNIVEEGVN